MSKISKAIIPSHIVQFLIYDVLSNHPFKFYLGHIAKYWHISDCLKSAGKFKHFTTSLGARMSSGSHKCYEMQSCHNSMRDIFRNNDRPRLKAFLAFLLSSKDTRHKLY